MEHKEGLLTVAERLLAKEKIDKDDMIELLGVRQWKERRTFHELSYAEGNGEEAKEEEKNSKEEKKVAEE